MGRDLEPRHVYPPSPEERPRFRRDVAPHNGALVRAEERARDAERGRRRAWFVTWALIVICGAQAAAIALMLPLNEVTPYTILVDKQTGYVETVRGIDLGALQEDEALVHSFVAQYVMQRETFDPADFENRYERVALWSADEARASYVALYQPGSPDSVLGDLRAGALVAVTVKQIELIDRSTARVRFELTQRTLGAAPITSDWQATMSFRFTGAPMRNADRLINPLGFQVVSYRRDAETPPPVPVPQTAEPTALEIRGSTDPDASPAPTHTTPAPGPPTRHALVEPAQ